jgi:hypothetical protein
MDQRTREIIRQEKDPRILHALIESMAEHIARQSELIREIEAEKAKQAQHSFLVDEKIRLLRRQIFATKSEIRANDRTRDKSQEDALLFSQAAFPSPESKGTKNTDKLECREIEHHVSDAELIEEGTLRGIENPSPNQWEETPFFDQVTKIQIIERSYVKEIHKKFKKKLKNQFNPDPDKDVFITASGEAALLPGMNYSTEFVASVASDKYISHLPLERQTREMESLGLKGMKTSTLSRMCGLAAASLEPIQAEILKELKASDLALHLDETPWKIQNKNEKDGYLWIISNRYGSYYFFKPTRAGQVIKDALEGYRGPVVSDGFSGYNILDETDISQGYCWAHARREFFKLEDHDPTVKPILDDIDELFGIEREAKNFDELKRLRKERSAIVLDRLKQMLLAEHPKSRHGSQKRKAIEYIQKRWPGFTLFLTDHRVPLSNNEAERTIRHAVVGRKNYYGSGNHVGADTAATLFTVIESCKKNDIDPRTYLLMTLDRVAKGEPTETPLTYARRTRQPAN